jgi:hypothetical protein
MISAVDEEGTRTEPLVSIKKKSDFRRPRSSINEITIEEIIVLLGWESVQPEKLQQIEVLA